MSGGTPVTYDVDSAELSRLADQLRMLHDELGAVVARMRVDTDAHALGGADVSSTLADFVGAWSTARNRLAEEIGSAQEFLRCTVTEYEGAETAVCRGVSLPFLADVKE
jgi:hypothetical protein